MPKTTARWNGQTIAASDDCMEVEGNAYFPPDAIDIKFFKTSDNTSAGHWKGTASYFDVLVNGKTNTDAAWVYREPLKAASPIEDYVAFWKGVEVNGREFGKPFP